MIESFTRTAKLVRESTVLVCTTSHVSCQF